MKSAYTGATEHRVDRHSTPGWSPWGHVAAEVREVKRSRLLRLTVCGVKVEKVRCFVL